MKIHRETIKIRRKRRLRSEISCWTFKCKEFFKKWTDRLTLILSLALCSRCYLSSETHSNICKFSHLHWSPSCSLLIEAVGHDIFWALQIQVRLLHWLCCLCLFDFLSGTRSIHLLSRSHKSTGEAQTGTSSVPNSARSRYGPGKSCDCGVKGWCCWFWEPHLIRWWLKW